MGPALRARGGRVRECGHPAASDATEGAFRANKGLPGGSAAQTIRTRLIWEQKPRFQ
jgi:hypothetical protein